MFDLSAEFPLKEGRFSGGGSLSDGELQRLLDGIALTLETVAPLASRVVVESESDLPPLDGDKHVLEAGVIYQINGSVTIANRIEAPSDAYIIGSAAGHDLIVYTGTGTMITVTGGAGTFMIENVALVCLTAQAFDVQGGGPGNFVLKSVGMAAATLGVFAATTNIFFSEVQGSQFGVGMLVTGTLTNFTTTQTGFTQTTGGSGNTILDLGDTVIDFVSMSGTRLITASGGIALSGLVDSGNIASGGAAQMTESFLNGPGTLLENITNQDLLWRFSAVLGVPDSKNLGHIFIPNGNTTPTAFSDSVTFVKVLGSTTAGVESKLEAVGDNRMTLRNPESSLLDTSISLTVNMASGGTADLEFALAKNGVVDTNTVFTASPSASQGRSSSVRIPILLATDDFIEVFMRNTSTTVSAIVSLMQFMAKE